METAYRQWVITQHPIWKEQYEKLTIAQKNAIKRVCEEEYFSDFLDLQEWFDSKYDRNILNTSFYPSLDNENECYEELMSFMY